MIYSAENPRKGDEACTWCEEERLLSPAALAGLRDQGHAADRALRGTWIDMSADIP